MIILRKIKEFTATGVTDSKSLPNEKNLALASPKPSDSSSNIPPKPNLMEFKNSIDSRGLATEMRLARQYEQRFSDRPAGTSYVGYNQVVNDLVIDPVQYISDEVGDNVLLKKPTKRWRQRINGYLDGMRLLHPKRNRRIRNESKKKSASSK